MSYICLLFFLLLVSYLFKFSLFVPLVFLIFFLRDFLKFFVPYVDGSRVNREAKEESDAVENSAYDSENSVEDSSSESDSSFSASDSDNSVEDSSYDSDPYPDSDPTSWPCVNCKRLTRRPVITRHVGYECARCWYKKMRRNIYIRYAGVALLRNIQV
jgi:hypothetical protein